MKRVFAVLLFTLLAGFCFRSPIYALENTFPADIKESEGGAITRGGHVSGVNTDNYSDFTLKTIGAVYGITTNQVGMTPYNQELAKNSAVSHISSYITSMYINPPASTYAFVQDMGQTLGFIPKQAYAQGIGFSGLTALLPVWKVFRNISYFVLAIIMIVIGFMVMFRKKIDPKTVVTVQNALPKIVVTLLLITFSYAIVGIAIDVMYILIALVTSVFQSTNLLPAGGPTQTSGVFDQVFKTIPESQLLYRILFGISKPSEIALLNMGSTLFIALGAVLTFTNPAIGIGTMLLSASPAIVGVLFGIGMLLLTIRLFVFFLSTYIKIIIALIFSPFQLLLEAVPGSKAFDSWIRGLIGNILIFPAASVLFLLAAVFMNLSTQGGTLWHPPFTGLFVDNATSVGALIAIGILFMIPNVGKQIHEALKSKPGMGGLEGVTGAFSGPTQLAMQGFQMWTSHQQMANLGKTLQAGKPTTDAGAHGGK